MMIPLRLELHQYSLVASDSFLSIVASLAGSRELDIDLPRPLHWDILAAAERDPLAISVCSLYSRGYSSPTQWLVVQHLSRV